MMITALIGKKMDQTQGFLEDGTRVPISSIWLDKNIIAQIKSEQKDKYNAIKLGFGTKGKPNKPEKGEAKKSGLTAAPNFLREVRVDSVEGFENAQEVLASEVFEPGDLVDITGVSKGKGYAGVVKRYHFKGGPKTHGQSDRHRAPGSIGSGTTPGRVYKGKKMAGRMGNEQVTIKNLEILGINEEIVLIKGLIPGVKGGLVFIKKAGKNKKFIPLYSEKNSAYSDKKEEEIVDEVVSEGVQSQVQELEEEKVDEKIEAVDKEQVGEALNQEEEKIEVAQDDSAQSENKDEEVISENQAIKDEVEDEKAEMPFEDKPTEDKEND